MTLASALMSAVGLSSQRAGLAALSCTVPMGACVAVIGPNGAGKTTLLRLLAGLDTPQKGEVLLGGVPLHSMSLQDRARRIAYLSQHEDPDPSFRVMDYVQLARLPFARTPSLDQVSIANAIERCDISAFLHMRLGQLSGGERQRVMLARCLAQTPDVLLLDEPTNHLDLAARAHLLHMVRGLDCAVVAVLHDLSLVPDFADHVLILHDGALVLQGDADEVLLSPLCADIFQLNIQRAALPDGTDMLTFQARLP